jgi:hypothetical protein
MGAVTCHTSILLDGFVAGPNQSHDNQNVGDPTLLPVKVVPWPGVTHIEYRVVHPS